MISPPSAGISSVTEETATARDGAVKTAITTAPPCSRRCRTEPRARLRALEEQRTDAGIVMALDHCVGRVDSDGERSGTSQIASFVDSRPCRAIQE